MHGFRTIALFLFCGCGGLGVEHYREARPHRSLAICRVVACENGVTRAPMQDPSLPEVCVSAPLTSRGDITAVQRLSSDADNAVLVLMLSERGRARLSAIPVDTTLAVLAHGHVQAMPHVHNVLDAQELYLRVPLTRIDAQFLAFTE